MGWICMNCCDLFLFCLFYRYFRSYLRCYFRILFTFKYQCITVIPLRQTGFWLYHEHKRITFCNLYS